MGLFDLFWLSFKGFMSKKARTFLTMLSIAVGVGAIVALVSLVSGINNAIISSLQSIGPTTIVVAPLGKSSLTAADVAMLSSFPNVSSVIPIVSFPATINVGGSKEQVTVYGMSSYDISNILGKLDIYSGALYNDSSLPFGLVGYEIAFPSTADNTQQVFVNQPVYISFYSGQSQKVASIIPSGILNKYGVTAFINPDFSVFLPIQAAQGMSNKYTYTTIIVKAKDTQSVAPLSSLISQVYGNNARVFSVQFITSTISNVTDMLAVLLGSIAGISLVVAGIGILSIMMVSVVERTKEIGILKAIGFKKAHIMLIFMLEAFIIGLTGGFLGSLLGTGLAYILPDFLTFRPVTNSTNSSLMARSSSPFGGSLFSPQQSRSFSFTPEVTPDLIVFSVFIGVFVSVASALYPAWKASTISPITAIRSE